MTVNDSVGMMLKYYSDLSKPNGLGSPNRIIIIFVTVSVGRSVSVNKTQKYI